MIGVFHPSNKPLLQVSNLDQNGTWILCAVKMISANTTSFPGPFPWFGSGDPQAREKALETRLLLTALAAFSRLRLLRDEKRAMGCSHVDTSHS